MALLFSKALIALLTLTYCVGIHAVPRSDENANAQLAPSSVAEIQPVTAVKPTALQQATRLGFNVRLKAYLKEGQLWLKESVPAVIDSSVLSLAQRTWRSSQNKEMSTSVAYQVPRASTGPSFVQKLDFMVFEVIVEFVIVVIVGYLYVKNKQIETVPADDKQSSLNGGFKHGLFQCCELPYLSIFTFCCPWARWADSMRMLGELSFVAGVFIWFGISVLGSLLTPIVFWLGIVILGTVYRQKIRKAFNMPSDGQTCFADCLSWCCCCCCSIVQEARQLEEAKELKHSAVDDKSYPLEFKCV